MRSSLHQQYDKHGVSGDFSGYKSLASTDKFVRNHDDVMIKDCDEDLNALLILAGLFATILTAFLASSTGWLQQDYTQVTADLLLHISTQLAEDSPQNAAQLPAFEAATIDIAINILWFLSLVLSLASALFGMIVKRWLREYPAWQTESLQEAICLRQIRYKAFLQWKVPLIVALLPGLLEMALVLFMVGIVAMLWTLNSLLAVIISISSAVFLIIAFSVVLIPALFHRCPYRSPAGWACVLVWGYACRFYYRLLWTAGLVSGAFLRNQLSRHRVPADWKQRDLHLNFADESGHNFDRCFDVETTKLMHLVDAVVWIYEKRQDDTLLDGLSYHIDVPELSNSVQSRLRIPIHATCRKFNITVDKLSEFLRSQYTQHNSAKGLVRYTLCLWDTWDVLHPWNSMSLQILGHFLLSELRKAAVLLKASDSPQLSPYDITMFVEALCFLYHITRTSSAHVLKQAYASFLVDLYRDSTREEDVESPSRIPSFKTITVQILRKMGSIRLYGGCISVDLNRTHMRFKDYARLAVQVYQENRDYANEESCHLFVTLADIAVQKCDAWYECVYYYDLEDLQSLLQCVEEAARTSLERGIPNCGHYGDLPWIASLSKAASSNAGLHTCIPLSLLRTLGSGIALGLFTGEGLQRELRRLKRRCACRDTVSVSPEAVPAEDPFATSVSTLKTPGSTSQSIVRVSCDGTSRTPLLSSPSVESLAGVIVQEGPFSSSPTSSSDVLAKAE
ncbi:uncharacterized protein PHACADRAFT_208235 [Phanerochaete carnosa HHB-10118-sp]|uniref:DUF6535 domain-containing protein n=1 Tax=Phanerochaete carnosa (strain HHB-10118-sp) TaxID=650164 RepID=K5VZS3_PHACS|nr:uncharacterized protein PHACADRAFT_208235 [Phanerochaete carnosa HHB-10118-sp]EKM57088.1 hypothetical protein PHACADRAFT_208235 [Phanerochaete carnosa HHB-10118-sp]